MPQGAPSKLPLPIRRHSILRDDGRPDNARPKRTCPNSVGETLNTPTPMRTGHHCRDIPRVTVPSPIHLVHGPTNPLPTNTQTGEMNIPVDVTTGIYTIPGVTATGDTAPISSVIIVKIYELPLLIAKVLNNLLLSVLVYSKM